MYPLRTRIEYYRENSHQWRDLDWQEANGNKNQKQNCSRLMMIVCYTKAHTVVACSRSQSRRTNIERERAVYMILLDSLSSPSSSSFLPSFLSFFLSFFHPLFRWWWSCTVLGGTKPELGWLFPFSILHVHILKPPLFLSLSNNAYIVIDAAAFDATMIFLHWNRLFSLSLFF